MISCGVPQGSVLGPLLFLIYINDIHNSSAKLSFYLFADDTSLLYADTNLKSLEKTVNSELLKKKSNYVIFRPYQRKLNYSVNIEMIDNCTQIPTTLQCEDHVKYLGVLLDSNLSWKFQINNVALKISRTVGVVARLIGTSSHVQPFQIFINH